MPIPLFGPDDDPVAFTGLSPLVLSGWDDGAGGATNRLLLEDGSGLLLEDSSGDLELES